MKRPQDHEVVLRRSDERDAVEPLRYDACGIPGLSLANGFVCEEDEAYGPLVTIVDRAGLHRAIALSLVGDVADLSPDGVRFLRKHLGLTQAALAERMGVDAQTIANYEKGRGVPGPSARLLRVLVLLDLLPKDLPAATVRAVLVSGQVPDDVRDAIGSGWRADALTPAPSPPRP